MLKYNKWVCLLKIYVIGKTKVQKLVLMFIEEWLNYTTLMQLTQVILWLLWKVKKNFRVVFLNNKCGPHIRLFSSIYLITSEFLTIFCSKIQSLNDILNFFLNLYMPCKAQIYSKLLHITNIYSFNSYYWKVIIYRTVYTYNHILIVSYTLYIKLWFLSLLMYN